MLRLYFDEHVDPRIASGLRSRGIDVLTAREAGRAHRGIPDPIQLSFAAIEGRAFVSGDWDFLSYSAQVPPHMGVIIVPRQVDSGHWYGDSVSRNCGDDWRAR